MKVMHEFGFCDALLENECLAGLAAVLTMLFSFFNFFCGLDMLRC